MFEGILPPEISTVSPLLGVLKTIIWGLVGVEITMQFSAHKPRKSPGTPALYHSAWFTSFMEPFYNGCTSQEALQHQFRTTVRCKQAQSNRSLQGTGRCPPGGRRQVLPAKDMGVAMSALRSFTTNGRTVSINDGTCTTKTYIQLLPTYCFRHITAKKSFKTGVPSPQESATDSRCL